MRIDGASVAHDGINKPEHIGGTDVPIETGPRVAPRDEPVTGLMHQPMNDESLILPEYNNRAGLEI